MRQNQAAGCVLWIVLCGGVGAAKAQHLNYADQGAADLIVNHVRSTAVAPNTYYEVFGWNPGGEAGGYTGIQFGSNRNMIFSIWDPSNGQAIRTIYQEPGSRSNPFGGEGTGLHWDNTPMGHTWNLNTTYTFVCRSWAVGSDHTQFGLWTRDESSGVWTHHVTMDFPMGGQSLSYGLNSFLELWAGYDAAYRYVEFSSTWSRRLTGAWTQLRSMWSDGGLNNPPAGVLDQGGLAGNAAYLRSGEGHSSNTTHSFTAPAQARPVYETAAVIAGGGTDDPTRGVFNVTWTLDPKRSPQFSYHLELYRTPDGSGPAFLTRDEVAGHVQSLPFTQAELAPGVYSGRVWVTDLFGQAAAPFTFIFHRPESTVGYVSDLAWVSSTNGWGPAEKDRSNGETGAADGRPMTLGGTVYSKGIGCHASSTITLNLGTGAHRFVSDIGMDDEVGGNGSVVFEVRRDGQVAYTSPTFTGDSATGNVDIDLAGGSQLQLKVTDAGDGNGSDHADWAGAAIVSYPCERLSLIGDVGTTARGVVRVPMSFGVQAAGAGPIAFRWRRNGQPIADIENATAASLILQIETPGTNDEGTYDCLITNACSSVTSRSCVLSVCIGDFDANGGVDGSDIESFFLSWEAGEEIADVNGDGGVDGSDVEVWFTRWAMGC